NDALPIYILNGDSKYKDLFHEARESSIENQKKIQALSTSSGIEELLQDTAEWQEVIQVEVFDEYDKGNENQAFASLEKSEHEIGRHSCQWKKNHDCSWCYQYFRHSN